MAPIIKSGLLAPVSSYYAQRLAEHGATARGVDWNGERSQQLRFAQLLRIIDARGPFSLNDLGCGYGAFLDYLSGQDLDVDYLGVDIAPEMITAARRAPRAGGHWRFETGASFDRSADYTVASGIFNVRLETSTPDWETLMLSTLDHLHERSTRGFAFNCLTSYSDTDKMRPHLHYADPLALFDHCKRRYARDVALLHDYGLYEFTLLIRKAP